MKENKIIVTIGIPFFNAEDYLSLAIKSVLNQSFRDFELILLDDGSSDLSMEIAKSFKDDRIVLISDGMNKGLSERLNQLVKLSNGKYFARMDSDDIMHVDRIKIQLEYLIKNKNIDLLGTNAFVIDKNNKVYGKMSVQETPERIDDVFNNQCFIHPTITGKTKWFMENPYSISDSRMEDAELWSRTILKSSFKNLDELLFYYRQAGIPYLNKYLQSQIGTRKLIKRNAKKKNKLILYSYFKSFAFILISTLGAQNLFFKIKNNNMSDSDIRNAQLFLNKNILK